MTTGMEYPQVQQRYAAVLPRIDTYRGFEESPRKVRPRSLITEAVVRGERHRLVRPVAVTLVSEGESWFAENEDLNLFGSGDTALSAIEDFRGHFEHFFERYRSLGWDEVVGEGLRLKKLYESLLPRNAA
jgi:hypothetical protein